EFLAFSPETAWVCVIVNFIVTVRPYDGCWRKNDFEGRRTVHQPVFQPGLLLLSPQAFIRSVRHVIRVAIVPTLHEPHLQMFAPGPGTIGFFSHRNSLEE